MQTGRPIAYIVFSALSSPLYAVLLVKVLTMPSILPVTSGGSSQVARNFLLQSAFARQSSIAWLASLAAVLTPLIFAPSFGVVDIFFLVSCKANWSAFSWLRPKNLAPFNSYHRSCIPHALRSFLDVWLRTK